MSPEEKQLLIDTAKTLNDFLDIYYRTNFPSKMVLTKKLVLQNQDIDTEGTVGSKIGNSGSKLSVYGVAPVVQGASISAPSTPGATYSQSEAQSAVNAINALILRIKNFGITL